MPRGPICVNLQLKHVSVSQMRAATPFFMVTHQCQAHFGSCFDADFESWQSKAGYETPNMTATIYRSQQRQSIRQRLVDNISLTRLLKYGAESGDVQSSAFSKTLTEQSEPLTTIVIFVAPCLRLLRTALDVCPIRPKGKSLLFNFVIRVDDRLRSSCCTPEAAQRRLRALANFFRENASDNWAGLQDFLDLPWIDQRLYDLEQTETPPPDFPSLDHIFDERRNRKDVDQLVAAIFVIGEGEEMVRMFRLLPLTYSPAMPRAGQFYSFIRTPGDINVWERGFLGTYKQNRNHDSGNANQIPSYLGVPYMPPTPSSSAASQESTKKRKWSPQSSPAPSHRYEAEEFR